MKLKIGDTIKVFYNKHNVNNKILHVRAIVDEEYIVLKRWSKRKQRWHYSIEHISWFDSIHEYMTVKGA